MDNIKVTLYVERSDSKNHKGHETLLALPLLFRGGVDRASLRVRAGVVKTTYEKATSAFQRILKKSNVAAIRERPILWSGRSRH